MKHLKTFEYYFPQDPMGMPPPSEPMRRGRFEEEEETDMPSFGEEEYYGEEEGGTCPSCKCTTCECSGEGEDGHGEDHFMHDAWDEMDDYEMGEDEISVGRIKKFEKMSQEDKEEAAKAYPPKNKLTKGDFIALAKKGKKAEAEKPNAKSKKGAQSKTPTKAQAQKSTKDEKKNPKS